MKAMLGAHALRRQWWRELLWMVLAGLFALTVGQKVIGHAQDGVQRWRADVDNGALGLQRPALEPLLQLWCGRDRAFLQAWVGEQLQEFCPSSSERLWQAVGRSDGASETTAQRTLARWQAELAARALQWRQRMLGQRASDVSATALSELANLEPNDSEPLSLERQAASEWLQSLDASQDRLEQWEAWQRGVLQPALKAPTQQSSALPLIRIARSLDGQGSDVAAQWVRRLAGAQQNAQRASQLLAMTDQLSQVLLTHWSLTLLLLVLLRLRLSIAHKIMGALLLALPSWGTLYALGVASHPLHATVWMIAGSLALVISWVGQTFFPRFLPPPKSLRAFSPWVMPTWWLFSALGWLLMLDQSLNFHPRNRFLALEQWQAWWVGVWLVPLAAVSMPWMAKAVLWLGALWFKPCHWHQHLLRLFWGVVVVFGMYLAPRLGWHQHITGELLKLLFVLALSAWCVWRMPSTSDVWHSGMRSRALLQAWHTVWIFVLAVVISWITRDKGPLLVICMAMVVLYSSLVGWMAGLVVILIGFLLIFLIGVDLDVVGSRLQAWRDPFTADHDDMARLMWFQAAAADQTWGFGPGQVPWCGTVSLDSCRGLPLQLQSDYTFTAIVGWWGLAGAMLLLLAFTVYWFNLLAHGARSSQKAMQPLAFLSLPTRLVAAQSHVLFWGATMMLVQTWITVAGNTGWLPLTGLTWPLLSFGKTSLLLSTWLLVSGSFGADDA